MTLSPAAAPAAEGDRYPQLLRTPRMGWWRPLLGMLLGSSVLVVGAVGLVTAAYVAAWATGQSDGALDADALDADTVIGLLANNLVIVVMIPAAVLAVLVVHRESPGWLAGVTGRPRPGLFGRLLGLAFAVVLVAFVLGLLLPSDSDVVADTPPAATLVGLLAVVLLTTPLQAAAEEVGFRGYLSQALASWVSRPVVGALLAGAVTSVLFALAHGLQDPWLFADRLAFGVVASWLAWRTGGLEAPVALHVANNIVSLVYASVTGSLAASLLASSLEWQFAVLDVVMMLTFAFVADRVVRRGGYAVRRVPAPPSAALESSASPGTLSAPGGVGYPGPRPPTPPPAGGDNPWGMG